MNKILAFILCILIALGNSALVLADTSNQIDPSELKEAGLVLDKLDVITENQDFTSVVTRADLSIFLAKLLSVDIYSISDKNYYDDIDKNFWAKTAIDNLTDMGIFTVGSNKLFRPNDNVTLNELCKVMIVVAGYNRLAEVKGGWPSGYLSVANKLDLLDNMNFDNGITLEQIVLMFYRTLKLNPLAMTGIEGDNGVYTVDKSETVMSLYYNIYEVSGQLTDVCNIGISGKSNLKENQVKIAGKVYDVLDNSVDLYSYLGLNVNCFYKNNKETGKREIVLVIPDEDNDIIQFSKEDMTGITDNGSTYSLTYYDERDKVKTIKIARGAAIIKNGRPVEEKILSSFNIEKGYFKLIDYDGDGKNDVVLIYEYYDMVVGQIVNPQGIRVESETPNSITWGDIASQQVIYDKYDDALAIDVLPDTDKVIKLKNSNGDYIELEDIAVGDVLSVYRSYDKKIIEVYKSSEVVRGTIDKLITDDGTSFVINGTTYKVSSECLKRANDFNVKAGFDGVFKLNMFGTIAYIEPTANSKITFGYLIDWAYDTNAFSEKLQLKIFGVDGIMHYLDMSDKAEIDGKMLKNHSDMWTRLKKNTGNGDVISSPPVIRYGLNNEGRINYIDTPYQDDDYETDASLRETGRAEKVQYSANKLGSKNAIISSTETVVLVVPDDATIKAKDYDDDWFKVMKVTSLAAATVNYTGVTYRYDEHADFEDVLVIKNGTGEMWGREMQTEPHIVDKVTQSVNEEGDRVNKIYAYYSGVNPVTLTTKDLNSLSGYDLKKGDMVWFKQDINNLVIGVREVLYKAGEGKTFEGPSYARTETGTVSYSDKAAFRVLECHVVEISGTVVRVGYQTDDEDTDYKEEIKESFNFPSTMIIYVYDKNAKKDGMIYKGTISDIVDYRKGGEDCSKLAIYTRNGTPVKAVVYR